MRQFVASSLPDKKGCIVLTEKEKRYLINVLRFKKDDEVSVRLPNGMVCTMSVQFNKNDIKKLGSVRLVALAPLDNAGDKENESLLNDVPEYWLFQFLPKGQKMDIIVRQATESGVHTIVPIVGEYSVTGKKTEQAGENAGKVERWMRIVREAQQQSGSSIDTRVFPPCDIETALSLWNNSLQDEHSESLAFVLCEKGENTKSVYSLVQKKHTLPTAKVAFAVGCEGGISPKELVLLQKNSFQPIHLKTNILRAETASIYSIAVLQSILGEYDTWMGLNV